MASFDPLSFFLVLLANSLAFLANLAASPSVLDLPEWRLPREYIRSEYEPEEICEYLVNWFLDSNDTTFVFCVFLGLLVIIFLLLILGFLWRYQLAQVKDKMAAYIEKVLDIAGTHVQKMGKVALDIIDRLRTRLLDLETRHRNDQGTITQLQTRHRADNDRITHIEDVNTTLQRQNTTFQSQITDLENRLSAEQTARQQDAEQALREKEKAVKAAVQQQQEGSSKLTDEHIKRLEKTHKSELEVQLRIVETAYRDTQAEKDKNSAIEQNNTDLRKELGEEKTSKAGLIKDMQKIRQEAKAAGDECTKAKKRQLELEQELNNAKECDKLSKDQHESDRKELESELSTVKSEKESLKGNLKAAEDELSELKQQSDVRAEEAADQAEQLKPAHQSEVEALNDNIKSINNKMSGFREQSETLQAKLETTLSENEKLKGDHEVDLVLLAHVEGRLASTENVLENRQTDLETTLSENKDLKSEHELALVLTSHAEQRLASTETLLKNCQSDLATEMSKNEHLWIEMKAMHVQNCAVQEELGRIEVINGNLGEGPERLQQAYDALQDEFDDAISHATAEKGELVTRLQELERELQAQGEEILNGQQEHQGALEAKDAERAKHVSSQDAKVAELEKSIEEARNSLSKRDNEFQNMQARLEAAEKESQDFKDQLRRASMERDELRQQRSADVEGQDDADTTDAVSSDTHLDAHLSADTTQDGELAMGMALKEAHAAAAAAEEQSDDEEAEEDGDNAGASQSSLHNDGEEDSWNDDSSNLDESPPVEKERKARNRAGNGGKLKKAMTAWNSGESIDGMQLTDHQQTIVAHTQARALRDSKTERSNPPISWFEHCRNLQQHTTPQVVAADTSRPAVDTTPLKPQADLVPSANEAQPASNPTSLQPQAALVATAIESHPAANPTPTQPQSALAATANEFMPAPEAIQPPQQRTGGLTGKLQHQPSNQTLQPLQQRNAGLTGESQDQPSKQTLQPPQQRVTGLSGSKSRWA